MIWFEADQAIIVSGDPYRNIDGNKMGGNHSGDLTSNKKVH
jgi:hypothetical protein